MISHRLTLDYSLSPGWMTPFVDGLYKGKAVAARCSACSKVSFPPLRCCDCGSTQYDWVELEEKADIVYRTDGADGSFALVQFAGADTHSVVKISGIPAGETAGRLLACGEGLPSIALGPDHEGSI